ncbi:MAG TPA: 30S ribosomal protein S21 [Candidatus Cybelea sp.]
MTHFEVGAYVRVRTARRQDICWRVADASSTIVIATNEKGGEIHYHYDSLELVDPSAVTQESTHREPAERPRGWYASSDMRAEIGDSACVQPRPGETIEQTLRRFKRAVDRAGLLSDYSRHRYFVKPSQRRRLKANRARQRRARQDAAFLQSSKNL